MITCPADSCASDLQRTVDGSLVDGVAIHLATVHAYPGPEAMRLALEAVQARGPGGCL